MSKEKNTFKEPKQKNWPTKIVTSVAFPWVIILIVVIYSAGVYTGWVGRSAENARIHSEALRLSDPASKE